MKPVFTRSCRQPILAAIASILITQFTTASAKELPLKQCKDHPKVSDGCFVVTGRARLYNGVPSIRIWPVGTRRLLGVSEGRFFHADYANFPPDIEKQLTWENSIWGDFEVCPFEPEKPGVMRLVCVQSVTNIQIRNE